jgi:X-X-X-Leu-X-X-Gly heptad repeat protein
MATTTEREIKIADGLGNADASQVLYGATFSSEDGFNIEGTFVPDASNITYNDTTVEVALDELVETTNNLPSAGTKLVETLPAGETTVTFTSDEITSDMKLNAVYTSIFGVQLESASVEDGSLVLTFDVQEEDMTVMALINATMSGEKSAYDYAVDGGYTGTEEEFATMLANLENILNDINERLDTKATLATGTEDLTAGTSELESGTIYCVYE